jgi:NADH:ubiquinone oxidoreductase subunit H
MISYELSFSLLLLSIIFSIKTVNITTIDHHYHYQSLFLLPFALLFLFTSIAELNRAPFDLAESESELVAGFFTEHSAFTFAYFFLGEYTNIITFSFLFLIFFNALFFLFLFIILWLRALLPRNKFDQLLFLGWADL